MKSTAAFPLCRPPRDRKRETSILSAVPAPTTAVRSGLAGPKGAAAAVCLALLLCSVPVSAAVQQGTAEMLRYTLACSIDEERASIECEADVWVRVLRDSLSSVTWSFPSDAAVISIHDASEKKIRQTAGGSPRNPRYYEVTCPVPENLGVNDSVMFRIRYTVSADTSAAADLFIGRREFVLQAGPLGGWVPMLSAAAGSSQRPHAPVILDVLLSSEFTLLSGGTVDSLYSRDGNTVWRVVRSDASAWEESFTLAGSKDVRPITAPGGAGRCGVTLYTSPALFQRHFAESIARMLGDASQYYAACDYRPRFDRLTFACIGTKSVNSRPVKSGSLVLLRNGPEHAVFDSSVFSSSANNVWLLETARAYAFAVPDSSYWFNESWAGYLSTRFLFARADTTDRLQFRERAYLLAHALDFFPTYPIAAGRTSRLNEDAVFLFKGRYVFLMLEYILGTETFDGVMRQVYARSRAVPPGITAMQTLCEAAYGSPLSWFFDQWLYRTGFPEYVLTSHTTATPRGTYEVTVSVTQRGDIFAMPLNVYFETAGRGFLKRIFMKEERQRFSFVFSSMPVKVEWNPQYLVLRWIPRYRILAHARTSISYRVFNRDLASSEKEAKLALQLDPDNNVGANGIALFSLGKAAGANKDWTRAEDYFLRASQQHDPEGYAYFPLLSVVRRANILEMLGGRDAAVPEYRRALESAERNPLLYSPVIIEAKRFLDKPYVQADDVWYDYY